MHKFPENRRSLILPTNTILAEITRDGEKIPVAMQLTKQGAIFTFHRYTGELLWEFEGPTSANATPMTCMAGGRQYVVVATGGHNWVYPFKKDDSLIARSLHD